MYIWNFLKITIYTINIYVHMKIFKNNYIYVHIKKLK